MDQQSWERGIVAPPGWTMTSDITMACESCPVVTMVDSRRFADSVAARHIHTSPERIADIRKELGA